MNSKNTACEEQEERVLPGRGDWNRDEGQGKGHLPLPEEGCHVEKGKYGGIRNKVLKEVLESRPGLRQLPGVGILHQAVSVACRRHHQIVVGVTALYGVAAQKLPILKVDHPPDLDEPARCLLGCLGVVMEVGPDQVESGKKSNVQGKIHYHEFLVRA